ncbi:MAG: YggW family oxidoreductase, partial [Gammaproteobacteria bacterium]|nr:YggW family oxidoreductase [Gammaproteobacteria bacterium]
PKLSQEENWEMQAQGYQLLEQAGFSQYEVSAFSQRPAKHNLNYWQFGDYLGIGAGAHGKITTKGDILRTVQSKSPKDFIENNQSTVTVVKQINFEFMLNALRLKQGFSSSLFEKRTGQSIETMREQLNKAHSLGLLELNNQRISPSKRGFELLNDLQVIFL